MSIPLHDVHEQRSCRSLNRLHDDLVLGCQRRVGKLQRIEVEDACQYLVRSNWPSVHEHTQCVERCCDKQAIAVISVYDIQQSIEQPVPFSFEAYVWYKRMIARCKGEGDIAVVGSL